MKGFLKYLLAIVLVATVAILLQGESADIKNQQVSLLREGTSDTKKRGVQLSQVEIRSGDPKKKQTTRRPSIEFLGAPLNPSILLFHKPHEKNGLQHIRRAAELQSQRVNVVISMMCEIDEARQVVGYGVVRHGKFVPLNEHLLSEFQETLRIIFTEVVEQGMEISVLVHLNSWGEVGDWRNHFRFDPLAKYRGYSYEEAMITPIAESIVATVTPETKVDFSLAGEMGRSVFTYAKSYRMLIKKLLKADRNSQMALGISLNFSQVAGEFQATPEEQKEVQKLINECDFLGLSNYRWFDLPPDADDFAKSLHLFLQEMMNHSVEVPRDMPLHFSEVAIGGCTENGRLTTSPAVAAKTPWEGSNQISQNPWKSPEMRKLRLSFYRELLDFLKHQPKTHRVTAAFLWSEGSWDPMGIDKAGFADEEITRLIQQHNRDVADR